LFAKPYFGESVISIIFSVFCGSLCGKYQSSESSLLSMSSSFLFLSTFAESADGLP
jgi:hypothetical protein